MENIIYQVDAFTSRAFKGNPAGVMICMEEPDSQFMQNIAMEMNLSETAFVTPANNEYSIRYFTPVNEVDLCGHATLSASHILYETGMAKPGSKIIFHSKAGKLIIVKKGSQIIMDFPVYNLKKIDIPSSFKDVTGLDALELYESDYDWKLVLVQSDKEVIQAEPRPDYLREAGLGELMVTAVSSNPQYDFVVRCFVPDLGIGEDPVTGSAHCALVPFWNMKTGKTWFKSFQASKRTGELELRLVNNRVEIAGEAVTVMRAELMI